MKSCNHEKTSWVLADLKPLINIFFTHSIRLNSKSNEPAHPQKRFLFRNLLPTKTNLQQNFANICCVIIFFISLNYLFVKPIKGFNCAKKLHIRRLSALDNSSSRPKVVFIATEKKKLH